MVILGEHAPRLWLDKVDFVEQWYGMGLVNVHPDYFGFHRCFLGRPGSLKGDWLR